MLTSTGVVLLVLIFAFAAFLLALPGVLGRRERRRRAATPDVSDDDAGSQARLEEQLASSRQPFRKLRDRWRARRLDDETWDDLEETLLLADVGVPTTTEILDALRARVRRDGVQDADALAPLLEAEITASLDHADRALNLHPGRPSVWLLVGVNGVGKTTTAAKLARLEQDAGRRVLLVAADTFRAAAAEQLAAWGALLGVDVMRGQEGGDPASVVFDAVQSAQARGIDVVIVDTAGRLHTQRNLMEELAKVRRIVERFEGALAEVLLVLDATTGQNGLVQAREFTSAVGVTGVVLAKLDGTAKGGIALSVEREVDAPVKLVGVGEAAEDLVAFEPAAFAAALVG
jgi:fused signal recognition particle receptor